jgi:hypothetical protein
MSTVGHISLPPRLRLRVSLNCKLDAYRVVHLLLRQDILRYWVGAEAQLAPFIGSAVQLPRGQFAAKSFQGLPVQSGQVVAARWLPESPTDGSHAHYVVLELESTFENPSPVSVHISVVSLERGKSRVTIRSVGHCSAGQVRGALKLWQGALTRLDRLLSRAAKRDARTRQAVIVVHGIGEQRPGQFLRDFVKGVFDSQEEIHFVRPDYRSKLFEMRMVSVPRSDGERPTTDVYEFYWAHLVRDTTLSQVYGWLVRLLFASGNVLPQTLVKHVWTLRIVLVLALLSIGVAIYRGDWSKMSQGMAAATGLLAILPFLLKMGWSFFSREFLLGYAGDAARYLEPRPENISRRQEIREEGADLLEKLHESGRYDRIIVYGHSLGSVIAYDILCHVWTRRFRKLEPSRQPKSAALRALEDVLNPPLGQTSVEAIEPIQQKQHRAWREYRRNGFSWLVSDFITAGSPLAHARWLMNLDKETRFDSLVAERTFAVCPPAAERPDNGTSYRKRYTFTFTHTYGDPALRIRGRSILVPHHAGLFALTRWSNLYFPFAGVIKGDPIGGPLKSSFGSWVNDCELTHPGGGPLGFAHSLYTLGASDTSHIARLRQALHLSYEKDVEDLLKESIAPTYRI